MTRTETLAQLPRRLVLVGAGKMGGSMLEGWLDAGLPPSGTTVVDPHPSPELERLAAERGFNLNPDGPGGPAPDVLVLGIKPQTLPEAAATAAGFVGPGTLLVSILAGKTVANLRQAVPGAAAMVRAMPNLPASIGRGATGAFAEPAVSPEQRGLADALLRCNGAVEWVEEEGLIDAITALSGSGPAYIFHLVEAMAHAGVAAGLPSGLASRLARATVTGSAALLDRSDLEPARLRENVTSKAGTTAAALDVLMPELSRLLERTVAAAKRRAGELSG